VDEIVTKMVVNEMVSW